MPSPIQKCTDAINRLTATQVTGQAAFIKAQAIRDLEEVRGEIVAMKLDHKRVQDRTNKALRKLQKEQEA